MIVTQAHTYPLLTERLKTATQDQLLTLVENADVRIGHWSGRFISVRGYEGRATYVEFSNAFERRNQELQQICQQQTQFIIQQMSPSSRPTTRSIDLGSSTKYNYGMAKLQDLFIRNKISSFNSPTDMPPLEAALATSQTRETSSSSSSLQVSDTQTAVERPKLEVSPPSWKTESSTHTPLGGHTLPIQPPASEVQQVPNSQTAVERPTLEVDPPAFKKLKSGI